MKTISEINTLQNDLVTLYKKGYFDVDRFYYEKTNGERKQERKTWSFWNSMFYCGTIYTTIGEFVCGKNEREKKIEFAPPSSHKILSSSLSLMFSLNVVISPKSK